MPEQNHPSDEAPGPMIVAIQREFHVAYHTAKRIHDALAALTEERDALQDKNKLYEAAVDGMTAERLIREREDEGGQA